MGPCKARPMVTPDRASKDKGGPSFEMHRTAAKCTQAAPAMAMLLGMRLVMWRPDAAPTGTSRW
jgi:hypothetical protein